MSRHARSTPRTVALVAVLVLGELGVVAGAGLEAQDVLTGLQAWLDATHDLELRFEQTLASGALGTGLEESGRLALLRPGRMRWDYLEPERKVALVIGQTTKLYLAEEHQLWEGSLPDDALLAPLLAGEERIAAAFDAALLPPAASGGYRLELKPRGAAASFTRVTLLLAQRDFAIEGAEVLDGAGNLMRYRFFDPRRNRGLPRTTFEFEPPPGTEVLRP